MKVKIKELWRNINQNYNYEMYILELQTTYMQMCEYYFTIVYLAA